MVAIQGTEGSFHYQAAQDYFGSGIDILECRSFDAVVKALLSGQAQTGVMAIENSIAGAILPNYALIDRNNLYIAGEYYMNIQHHLMALPGQTLSDITEVHSHYMALLQCKDFFEDYPQIKLVEATNTAQAAKEIRQGQLNGIAAIASTSAAALYGLEILAEGIQTILRREGVPDAYELLKDLTRRDVPPKQQEFEEFIAQLPVSAEVKRELRAITPFTYTGVKI